MRSTDRSCATAAVATVMLLAAACSAPIVGEPVRMAATPAIEAEHVLLTEVVVTAASGAERRIPRGSRWRFVGTIPPGDVYRRIDDVFVMEGTPMREAYLVINNGRVVGLYLPAEKSFATLRSEVPIEFRGGGS